MVAALGVASPVRASDPRSAELLERHRPRLAYDSAERLHAQPVSLPPQRPRVRPGDRVYGHVAREDGDTWLQYWLFFADNPQDRGLVATGRHAGDWELLQLRLGAGADPDLATLSQHSWAEGCPASALEPASGRDIPVLYVANGSHALYSRPGTHDRPFPDPNDEADGGGRQVRPPLRRIFPKRPSWVAFDGRWGPSRAGIWPGEASSPHGPRFQEHGAWQSPGSYHARTAVPCGTGPPGAWWQRAAVAALGLGVAGLIFVRGWRRRRAAA